MSGTTQGNNNVIYANVQYRRQQILQTLIDELSKPYSQYDNKKNIEILKAIATTMLNCSYLGYDLKDRWEDQTGEIQDEVIQSLFKIYRSFEQTVLTDEQYARVASFAQEMRTLDINNILSIKNAINKYITHNFLVISVPASLTYFIVCEQPIINALLYYKLLPRKLGANNKLITIPSDLNDKVWWWSYIVNHQYWMPTMGAPLIYLGEQGDVRNPLLLRPEWFHSLNN